MSELISIIVPIYNVDPYLDVCVKSIVEQSYENTEILLIDDGSKDNSGIIADEWSKRDKRVRVIHKENGGLSSARNAGLEIAKGEFIAFVDSDDYIDIHFLEKLYTAQQTYDADVAICYENTFEDGKEVVYRALHTNRVVFEEHKEFVYHFNDAFRGYISWAWNKLYKRSVIGDKRFTEGRMIEDLIFMADILPNIKKVVWIPERLYLYRQRSTSIMHTNYQKRTEDYLFAIQHECDIINDTETETTFLNLHNYKVLCMMYQLYNEAVNEANDYIKSITKEKYLCFYKQIDWKRIAFKKRIKYFFITYFLLK